VDTTSTDGEPSALSATHAFSTTAVHRTAEQARWPWCSPVLVSPLREFGVRRPLQRSERWRRVAEERGRRSSMCTAGWPCPIGRGVSNEPADCSARFVPSHQPLCLTPTPSFAACEQARNDVLGAQGRAPSAVSSRRVNRQHRARVLDCIQNEEYWLSSKSAEA
jgi:hypothetical protein